LNNDTLLEEDDDFEVAALMLAQSIKTFGARDLWIQLKTCYPKEFNEMLYYALDQLKK